MLDCRGDRRLLSERDEVGAFGYWSRIRLAGLAAMALLGLIARFASPLALLAGTTGILIVVAAVERIWLTRRQKAKTQGLAWQLRPTSAHTQQPPVAWCVFKNGAAGAHRLFQFVRRLIIWLLMINTDANVSEAAVVVEQGKRFGYVVHGLERLLRRRFDMLAQHHGLTLPQWRLIGQLSERDALSQVVLAGLLDTDPMTVSGLVERLEGKGLVHRITDPHDSRAKIVMLTDKARALYAEIRRLVDGIALEMFEGTSDAQRATALRVLQRMSANLSK
ncbi:MAG: MarR family transcriptional regulator [Hyphomicrobiales bacterium]|nr:MarR family transcriptional regulator [Hyphomicrobiales bacterium]